MAGVDQLGGISLAGDISAVALQRRGWRGGVEPCPTLLHRLKTELAEELFSPSYGGTFLQLLMVSRDDRV